MAVLSFPLKVQAMRRTLESATGTVRSQFTGTEQVQFWGGEWWAYEVEMAITQGADGQALMAFFTALRGRKNTFTFADPKAAYVGTQGTPLVAGAGQTGDTLDTDGWSASAVIKAGRFFSLGSGALARLHMVTADVTADGSGAATLNIAPPLRSSPDDNAAIEYNDPIVHLRLDGPAPAEMSRADLYRFSFRAREAL